MTRDAGREPGKSSRTRRRESTRRPPAGGLSNAGVEHVEPEGIRDALNCVAAGVVKVSKDERIVYANAYVRQVFGKPDRNPLEVPVRDYEEFLFREDGTPLPYEETPAIRCLRTGKLQGPMTIGLNVPGDQLRWITITAVPLLDAAGEPESAIVTVVDSSHPKHVEESLRASEDRYRRLVELAPDAIIVHRIGPILYINDAGVKLYGGRSREDFLGRDVLELIPVKRREVVRLRIQQAAEGEPTPVVMQRHVRLDGSPVYVEVTGTRCIFKGHKCVQVICRDVTRRRSAERELRRAKAELEVRVRQRTQELSDKNAQLQQEQRFMEQTLSAGERDRKLVAYEIHDTILQDVIGALMLLDASQGSVQDENARRLEQSGKLLRKCIGEARRMISGLRPLILDEQGIAGAVDYLVNEFNARGMQVRFANAMQAQRLPAELENTVFRIVQEALTNVERHSQTQHGNVRIAQTNGTLHIEVRDEGVGFDPQQVAEGHFGLEAIQQRAKLAGGQATITSRPGEGTTVVVELPIGSPAEFLDPVDDEHRWD